MDPKAFDDVARSLASTGTRRGLLRSGLAIAGALAGLGVADHARAATKRAPGEICRKHGDCASGTCLPADGTGRRRCGCSTAADCPTPTNLCQTATCTNGVCGAGPRDCDDNNACTIDGCDPSIGCHHTQLICDDSNACTADTCDPTSGCVFTPISCNDNNPCTVDTCDPTLGCQNIPIACGSVPDGNGGTVCCGGCGGESTCTGGACVAAPACACQHGPTSLTLAEGGTMFFDGGAVCLSPCTSDADCACGQFCVASYGLCLTGTPQTTCDTSGFPPGAYCAEVNVCAPPG